MLENSSIEFMPKPVDFRSTLSRRSFLIASSAAVAGFALSAGKTEAASPNWTDANWFPYDPSWGLSSLEQALRPLDLVLQRAGLPSGAAEWERQFTDRVIKTHDAGHCHALAIAAYYNAKPSPETTYPYDVKFDYINKLAAIVALHSGDPMMTFNPAVLVNRLRDYGEGFIANMPDEPGIWVRGVYEYVGANSVRATAWSAGSVVRPTSKIAWAGIPAHRTMTPGLSEMNKEWRNPVVDQNKDFILNLIYS